jgi:hypothetical protein
MPKTTNPAIPAGAEGPIGIGHSPEVAQPYQDAAAYHRMRQSSGLPPAGAVTQPAQAPAPGEAPLPMIGVARHFLAKELATLRQKAEGAERWLNTSGIGMGGMQVPGVATQRQSVRGELEALQASITALEALDDQAVQVWARDRGVR